MPESKINNVEVKIGTIVEGEVTHITTFGAFIKITETKEDGLVHISEVANEYVTNINDFVKIGDKVKVKVLKRNEKKQLELSIKRANAPEKEETALFIHKKTKNNDFEDKLTSFLKRAEEKQIDLRRNLKNKQGIIKKKRK